MLYLFVPVLKSKICSVYIAHFALLASAMHKLLDVKTSDSELEEAEEQLKTFLRLIDDLNYPDGLKRYNTHLISHLYADRKFLGPLRYYNAFNYENQLGIFKSWIKKSTFVAQQLCYKAHLKLLLTASNPVQKTVVPGRRREYSPIGAEADFFRDIGEDISF